MSKDILFIRPSKKLNCYSDSDRRKLVDIFESKFEGVYKIIVIFSENETDTTTFQIIKY